MAGGLRSCSARPACRSGSGCARTLPETIHLQAEAGAAAKAAPAIVSSAIRATAGIIVLGLLILASGTISTYVTQYMTTYAENTLHVATDLAFATSLVSNGLGIVGALVGGWLADRHGRWPVMVWPQLAALLLTYPIFLWIVDTPERVVAAGRLRFAVADRQLPYSAFYVAFTEGLPQNIRGGASPPSTRSRSRASAAPRSWSSPGSFMSPAMRWRRPGTCCWPPRSGSPPWR